MRGLSQIIIVKGKKYAADNEYDRHLSSDSEAAKKRIKELEAEGYEAIYRRVVFTGGTEEGIQVYKRLRE